MTDIAAVEHPLGRVRQGILDHLVDTAPEPQTVAQLIAALGTVSRNTVESAIRRNWESGLIERVAPGTYILAKPKPQEPSKPEAPPEPEALRGDGQTDPTDEEWLDALERYFENPANWDLERFGPPPDVRPNRIPPHVALRMSDRLRKREQRRREAEEPDARRAAADAKLRNQLLAACNGNYQASPSIDDMTIPRLILETVPIEYLEYALRQKVDKRCFPGNPPLTSWRDAGFLRAAAENFCGSMIIPSLVDAWSKAKPPGKVVDAPHTATHVQVVPERKDAPAASPAQSEARPGDDLDKTTAAPAVHPEGREQILAAFTRNRRGTLSYEPLD